MSKQVCIPDILFQRLQALEVPGIDTPANVIERLLDAYESQGSAPPRPARHVAQPSHGADQQPVGAHLAQRPSRARGTIVEIGDHRIHARSVSDLYLQTLKYLCENGYRHTLDPHLPIATSRQRYLIAKTARHPTGKPFVVPVAWHGYYMEAHKDYKEGIAHLGKMLDCCGLRLTYRR